MERYVIHRLHYIQLACYFYTEIPLRQEVSHIREAYLEDLAKKKAKLDSKLEGGTLDSGDIKALMDRIMEEVERVYQEVQRTGFLSIPATFKGQTD